MEIRENYYKNTEYLLYNYRMFMISIENMLTEIKYLKQEDGSKGMAYDGISTGKNYKISSITEDTALSVVEKIDYLEHSINRVQNKLDKVDRALDGLTDIEKNIILKRYVEGKQWYVVAYEVSYNERWCKELRKRAIGKMALGIFGDTALLKHEKIEKV